MFALSQYAFLTPSKIPIGRNRYACQSNQIWSDTNMKISITNIRGILHHSAHVRKQTTIKILCFVICVEEYHKLTQTRFLFQSPSAILSSLISASVLSYDKKGDKKRLGLNRTGKSWNILHVWYLACSNAFLQSYIYLTGLYDTKWPVEKHFICMYFVYYDTKALGELANIVAETLFPAMFPECV